MLQSSGDLTKTVNIQFELIDGSMPPCLTLEFVSEATKALITVKDLISRTRQSCYCHFRMTFPENDAVIRIKIYEKTSTTFKQDVVVDLMEINAESEMNYTIGSKGKSLRMTLSQVLQDSQCQQQDSQDGQRSQIGFAFPNPEASMSAIIANNEFIKARKEFLKHYYSQKQMQNYGTVLNGESSGSFRDRVLEMLSEVKGLQRKRAQKASVLRAVDQNGRIKVSQQEKLHKKLGEAQKEDLDEFRKVLGKMSARPNGRNFALILQILKVIEIKDQDDDQIDMMDQSPYRAIA